MFSTRLANYSPDSDFYNVDPDIKSTEDHQAFFKEFVENYFNNVQDEGQTLDEYLSPENLENIDRDKRQEYCREQAGSNVDIYNKDLREKARDFSDRIQDALDEFGREPRKSTLTQLFQMGQQLFYENLFQYGLDNLKQFLEEENKSE